jgi:hypothetical protein
MLAEAFGTKICGDAVRTAAPVIDRFRKPLRDMGD